MDDLGNLFDLNKVGVEYKVPPLASYLEEQKKNYPMFDMELMHGDKYEHKSIYWRGRTIILRTEACKLENLSVSSFQDNRSTEYKCSQRYRQKEREYSQIANELKEQELLNNVRKKPLIGEVTSILVLNYLESTDQVTCALKTVYHI